MMNIFYIKNLPTCKHLKDKTSHGTSDKYTCSTTTCSFLADPVSLKTTVLNKRDTSSVCSDKSHNHPPRFLRYNCDST